MNRALHLYLGCVGLLLIFSLGSGCSRQQAKDPVVARVGDVEVHFSDFMLRFTLFPQFKPNSTMREARLEELNHVIDRFILWQAAELDGLDRDPDIQAYLNYILRQETLKYLYKKEVYEKIPVTDRDAWEEYKRRNIRIRLRHLFAPTQEQALVFKKRLEEGATFEQLAREAFFDSTLANNGGDLGYVNFTDLDPLLADSIYNLPLHQVAGPLESTYGYHVVRVEDVMVNVFAGREEFRRQKEKLKEAVRQRRMKRAGAVFVKKALHGQTVHIKRAVLRRLLQISRSTVPPVRSERPLLTPRITDLDISRIRQRSEALLSQPLVGFDHQVWTVADFLQRLKWTAPLRRPALHKEAVVARHIIHMVRDELLWQLAVKNGYHRAREVRESVQLWRRELLADEFQKRIRWTVYRDKNPQVWQRRLALYRHLKETLPVKIYTDALFHDVSEKDLLKRQVNIPVVVRNYYIW